MKAPTTLAALNISKKKKKKKPLGLSLALKTRVRCTRYVARGPPAKWREQTRTYLLLGVRPIAASQIALKWLSAGTQPWLLKFLWLRSRRLQPFVEKRRRFEETDVLETKTCEHRALRTENGEAFDCYCMSQNGNNDFLILVVFKRQNILLKKVQK